MNDIVIKKDVEAAPVDNYSKRTIVIGDIHGAAKAFDALLDKLELRQEDTIILLGDYIDGYPEPLQVIDIIMNLMENYNVIALKGNHDEFANRFFQTGVIHPDWRNNGGNISIKEFKGMIQQNPEMFDIYHNFFRKLHLYYIDDQNNFFVHAGFEPTRTLSENKSYFGEQIFYWDRDLINYAYKKHNSKNNKVGFIPSQEMFKEIFVGHTTTRTYSEDCLPINLLNLWMLDTGGGWAGKITAMDIHTKEVWQSDFTSKYYPNWKHD